MRSRKRMIDSLEAQKKLPRLRVVVPVVVVVVMMMVVMVV